MEQFKKEKWTYWQLPPNFEPTDEIIKFINYNQKVEIDFLLFGNNGYRAQSQKKTFFGRTAE